MLVSKAFFNWNKEGARSLRLLATLVPRLYVTIRNIFPTLIILSILFNYLVYNITIDNIKDIQF